MLAPSLHWKRPRSCQSLNMLLTVSLARHQGDSLADSDRKESPHWQAADVGWERESSISSVPTASPVEFQLSLYQGLPA